MAEYRIGCDHMKDWRPQRLGAPSVRTEPGRHSGDEGDWLFKPMPDRRYVPGTAVPLLSLRYGPRPSGVLVPESTLKGPQPVDLITTYITAEEIFGQRLGLEFVRHVLPQVSRDRLLTWCAELLGFYEAVGGSRKDLDHALIDHWRFQEPVATRPGAMSMASHTMRRRPTSTLPEPKIREEKLQVSRVLQPVTVRRTAPGFV